MSSKENVLIKEGSGRGSDQFTLSPCPVVLRAAPCICVAERAWWNSVYDVLLNTVNPCLHTVIVLPIDTLIMPSLRGYS